MRLIPSSPITIVEFGTVNERVLPSEEERLLTSNSGPPGSFTNAMLFPVGKKPFPFIVTFVPAIPEAGLKLVATGLVVFDGTSTVRVLLNNSTWEKFSGKGSRIKEALVG